MLLIQLEKFNVLMNIQKHTIGIMQKNIITKTLKITNKMIYVS